MNKSYLLILVVATLFSLLTTSSIWKLNAQEEAALPPTTEEFAPNLEEESDLEFVKSAELLEDSELLEMLISDSGFLDVLEEFSEDIGIEEEEVPYEILEESNLFSGQPGGMETEKAQTPPINEEGGVK